VGVARSLEVTGTVIVVGVTDKGVRFDPLTETSDPVAKPVPVRVSVKPVLPEGAVLGLRLVSVSGTLVILKLAKTRVSSFAVSESGFVVPVRSNVQPAKVQPVDGEAVYCKSCPVG